MSSTAVSGGMIAIGSMPPETEARLTSSSHPTWTGYRRCLGGTLRGRDSSGITCKHPQGPR